MLIDTHCHLYKEYYDDIESIIELSKQNNVMYYINNGCGAKSNIEVLELIEKYDNVYGALGIHPEYVSNYTLDDIKFIEDNLSNEKIVAIGEIGLDYYYSKENKNEQIELLEIQLKLAEKYNKVRGVIHSFSGSLETAKIYIKMGYLFGINGVVTFKNCNLKDTLKEIPIDNIVLETDSPYLTPVPYRGKQNNPSHILDIAKFISEVYEINIDEVMRITTANVKKVYNKLTIE